MTAKEYLKSLRTLDFEIKVKVDELYYLKSKSCSVNAQTINERVSNSTTNESMQLVDKIVDLQNEINAEIDKLIDKKKEAKNLIAKISCVKCRLILTLYYTCAFEISEIADSIEKSERQIVRLKRKAEMEFEKIYKNFENVT